MDLFSIHPAVGMLAISLLVLMRHTDNIRRLISGTELSGSQGA